MNSSQTSGDSIRRLDRLAWILDNSIRVPGTQYRIGLDGFIGLIPGIGDVAGAAVSSYIVAQAARHGAPVSLLIRMGLNVLTDSVVGIVPLFGDLFDFGYKANARNVRLLRRHIDASGDGRLENRLVAGAAVALIIAAITGVAILAIAILRWAWAVATSSVA